MRQALNRRAHSSANDDAKLTLARLPTTAAQGDVYLCADIATKREWVVKVRPGALCPSLSRPVNVLSSVRLFHR